MRASPSMLTSCPRVLALGVESPAEMGMLCDCTHPSAAAAESLSGGGGAGGGGGAVWHAATSASVRMATDESGVRMCMGCLAAIYRPRGMRVMSETPRHLPAGYPGPDRAGARTPGRRPRGYGRAGEAA